MACFEKDKVTLADAYSEAHNRHNASRRIHPTPPVRFSPGGHASHRREVGTGSAAAPHLDMGEQGEMAALFHQRQNGYVVVAQRWRTPKQRGDIDLIAWEGDTLCFVEVKTRASRAVATAESAVDEDKRTTLRRMARHYLKAVDPPAEAVRFDVVSVYLEPQTTEITLYRWAFDW